MKDIYKIFVEVLDLVIKLLWMSLLILWLMDGSKIIVKS